MTSPASKSSRTPNPEQAAALASRHARKLLLASAGSGKTSALCWQIEDWLAEGLNPAKMVCISFTNAAADEYASRLPGVRLGFMGTLHAWCLRICNVQHQRAGKAGQITVLDEEASAAMIRAELEAIKASSKWTVNEVRRWLPTSSIANPAAIAARQYRRKLTQKGLVDFDTVLLDALEAIRAGFVDALDAVLVDEYQDSSPIHALIYEALLGITGKFFVVGDPDQAIYGHAGGDVGNILAMAESSEWQLHKLVTNHRCPVSVVDAANRLIGYNTSRIEKTMTAWEGASDGITKVFRPDTIAAEAALVAGMIKRNQSRGSKGTVAILARYNAQVQPFISALSAEGIAFVGDGWDTDGWVKLAISALSALIDPNDDEAAAPWVNHVLVRPETFATFQAEAKAAGISLTAYLLSQQPGSFLSMPAAQKIREMKLPEMAVHNLVAHWKPTLEETREAILGLVRKVAVHVGTIHSFKGRQAKTVFLVGMSAACMPAKKTGEELEAERRLFYVGITRTEETLFISAPREFCPPFGRPEAAPAPSPFIKEAGL